MIESVCAFAADEQFVICLLVFLHEHVHFRHRKRHRDMRYCWHDDRAYDLALVYVERFWKLSQTGQLQICR